MTASESTAKVSAAEPDADPGPDPKAGGGSVTVIGTITYDNVITDDQAGLELPESLHPYLPNTDISKTLVEPGATEIWILFSRVEIESGYDHLYGKDGDGMIVWQSDLGYNDKVTYDNLWVSVPGDVARVEFTSNGIVEYWGYNVAKMARDSVTYGVKWATVQIWDADDIFGDHLLDTVLTDPSGHFVSNAIPNTDESGTRDIYVRVVTSSTAGDVVMEWGDVYDGFTSINLDVPDGTLDMGTWSVPDSENSAWIVYTTMMDGWDYLTNGPAQWTPPYVRTVWTLGHDARYGFPDCTEEQHYHTGGEIHLDSNDAQSPDTTLHEYAHMVMYRGYDNWYPPSAGGPHYWYGQSGPNLAWAEGWADFLFAPAQLWVGRGNSQYDDYWLNLRQPLEDTPSWPGGDTNEGAIASALYDIYDSSVDDADTYSGGFLKIWNVLRSAQQPDLSAWFSSWRSYFATSPFDIHYAKVNLFQNTIDYDLWAPWVANLEAVTSPTNGFFQGTVQVRAEIGDDDLEDSQYLNLQFQYQSGSDWITFDDTGTVAAGWRDGFWDTTTVADGLYTYRALVSDGMESSYITRTNGIDIDNTHPSTPGTPTWTSGDETDGVVMLSWMGSTDVYSGVWRYQLQRKPDGGTWSTVSSTISSTSYTVSLSPGTYYFRVRAQDRAGNLGAFSATSGPLTVPGGGGGGSPFVATWNGTDYVLDNNILPKSEDSSRDALSVADYYRLHQPLVPKDGRYALQIVEFEDEHTRLDHVRLLAVDHDRDFRIAVDPVGEIYTFEDPEPPASAVDNYGLDRLDILSVEDGAYYEAWRGDYLDLAFGRVLASDARLLLKADICNACKMSVNAYVLQNGIWVYVNTVHPRIHFAWEVIDLSGYLPSGDLVIRLSTTRYHKLDFVGLDTSPPHSTHAQEATLLAAVHSETGDVISLLTIEDGQYVNITPGQQVTLEFEIPVMLDDQRSFILVSHGYYTHKYQPYGGEDLAIDGLSLQASAFLPEPTPVFWWDVEIMGLTWDFGDGATATGSAVTHAYGRAGEYVLAVEVEYADGTIERYERTVILSG